MLKISRLGFNLVKAGQGEVSPRAFSMTSVRRDSDTFKIKDQKDFETLVMGNKKPVVVDFFATWCSPCKALAPRIEAVIKGLNGQVVLAKVDIDELQDLAMEYEVDSVPVLMAFENGKVVNKMVGLKSVDAIKQFVKDSLKIEEKTKS